MIQIRLLGAFEVVKNGRQVRLPSRQAQALLAYLALHPGPHRREKLAGQLWPEASDQNARSRLRNSLHQLRGTLGPDVVAGEKIEVGLNPAAAVASDVGAILAAASGRDQSSPSLLTECMQAMQAFKGELLPGFYDEWVDPARKTLGDRAEQNFQRIVDELGQADRVDEQIRWCQAWLDFDPSSEPATKALMQAYAQRGERARVSRVFQDYTAHLEKEFSLAPSVTMLSFYQSLVNGKEAAVRTKDHRRLVGSRKHSSAHSESPWKRLSLLLPLLLLGSYLLGAEATGASPVQLPQTPLVTVVGQFPLVADTQFGFTPPLRVQATSDGRLAIVNEDSGEYETLKIESLFILEVAFAGRPDRFVVLAHQSPDSFRGDFFLANFADGSIQQLTDSSDTVPKGPPSFSRSGGELLFADGGAVRILDLTSGLLATVVPPDGNLSWIVSANWSPDNEWIVYLRVAPTCNECTQTVFVSIIHPDGTDERQLYSTQSPDLIVGSVGFSPDGKYVGFAEASKNYIVAVDGSSSPIEADENIWTWLPNYFPQWP